MALIAMAYMPEHVPSHFSDAQKRYVIDSDDYREFITNYEESYESYVESICDYEIYIYRNTLTDLGL